MMGVLHSGTAETFISGAKGNCKEEERGSSACNENTSQ